MLYSILRVAKKIWEFLSQINHRLAQFSLYALFSFLSKLTLVEGVVSVGRFVMSGQTKREPSNVRLRMKRGEWTLIRPNLA